MTYKRWIIKLYDENTLDELPSFAEEWRDTKSEGCMYPQWMLERGLNIWEIQFCPWWVDFPIGEFPIEEGHLYKGMLNFYYKSCRTDTCL